MALKIIKHGMDTKQVVARFEAERQALAMMDHPSVAKVFEAGATPRGRPYFVMEFVRGVPITEHCDRQKLPVRERLELFLQVCEGVQHAHQNAIIHRDLKPSNVLVSIQDGRAVPKIIDFGVAKATTQKLTEKTMFTELGVLIGTPEYMSPEQAEGTGQSVDTRTDVYSLGVMLYELLVGALPFDSRELRSGGYEGIRKKIREDDPPNPSTRVSTLVPRSAEVARHRQINAAGLRRSLSGELDCIIMKAMHKDRVHRYPSAYEFANDVRRYLNHEPVVARSPGPLYRFGKFSRRHRAGVAAASLTLVALVVGFIVAYVGMVRAQRAEAAAALEARSSEAIASYLVKIFRDAKPTHTSADELTAREILDDTAATVRENFPDKPGIRGRVMSAMGSAYLGLAVHPEAKGFLLEALPLLREAYGENHRSVFDALNELGVLSSTLKDFEGAIAYYKEALEVAEETIARDDPATWNVLKNLADANLKLGSLDVARDLYEQVLELRVQHLGPEDWKVARTLRSLSDLYIKLGDPDRAVETATRSLEIRKKVKGSDYAEVGFGYFTLGDALVAAGKYEEALESFESAREHWGKIYRPDHERIGFCVYRMAKAQLKLGDLDAAYDLYRQARKIEENSLAAPEYGCTLAESLKGFAAFLDELGRPDEARATRQEAARLCTP